MPESGEQASASRSRASELCANIELDDESRALLSEGLSPRQFLDLLLKNKLYSDAIKFLARALPKRDAVRWALGCVRPAIDPSSKAKEIACLDAAEKWVANPDEVTRLAAKDAAESDGYGSPGSWVAAAAGWSSGSLSPPDMPAVPAPDHLTAHAVACAIMVVAAKDPKLIEKKQLALLQEGMQLARSLA